MEEVVGRITASRGSTQRLVSEIFLAVDTVLREDEVRRNATRLFEQVRAGANFAALARQFSESATTVRGGDLGWVEEVVGRITASRGSTQRLVSEIFLAVDTVLREDEVRRNATRLFEQVRAGANFAALARQFSESATTVRGGDLGWVQPRLAAAAAFRNHLR